MAVKYQLVPSVLTESRDEDAEDLASKETESSARLSIPSENEEKIRQNSADSLMPRVGSPKTKTSLASTQVRACDEAKAFLGIALPTMIIQSSILGLGTLTTAYVGQILGRHALTGVSISNLLANSLGNSLIFGMLSGLESLGPQAIGAGRYAEIGYLAQTCAMLCYGLMFVILLLYWNAAPILRFLGQPEESIGYAGRFLRLYSFGLPADILYNAVRRFFWCQSIVSPFVVISVAVFIIHWLYLHFFITWMEFGFEGAALAHVASSYTQLLFASAYAQWLAGYNPETWKGLNRTEALRRNRVKSCLRLGISGVLAYSELWYWEFVCVLAGSLGELELASHTIAYKVVPHAFMLPVGIGIAATTRVAFLVGKNELKRARMVSFLALVTALLAGALSSTLAYSWREQIFAAFAGNDIEIHTMTQEIWPYVCVFIIVDAFNGTISGIFRGLAAQLYLSVVVFVCLWLLGVPIMYVWSISYRHGLVGIWQTMMSLYVTLVTLQLLVCYKVVDWHNQGNLVTS